MTISFIPQKQKSVFAPTAQSCDMYASMRCVHLKVDCTFTSSSTLWGLCCCCSLVAKSCPALCDPMDYSPPGSSVHEIFQVRILGRVAISYSRGSSWPRDQTQVSYIGRQILYHWASRGALGALLGSYYYFCFRDEGTKAQGKRLNFLSYPELVHSRARSWARDF